MNLNRILVTFFDKSSSVPTIEVFDETSLFSVYKNVIDVLQQVPEIEQNVVKGLAFCLYEVLDNVIYHSGKKSGTVIVQYNKEQSRMRVVVADDGIGIWKSISNNPIYKDIDEPTAISICIQKDVTEGNGMGFGLFSATRLIANAGISLQIHSGNHLLTFDGKQSEIREERFWQGTIVYLDLHSNVDFNPEEVANDCSEGFDEMFLDEGETSLW